jgi:hypothetical protein
MTKTLRTRVINVNSANKSSAKKEKSHFDFLGLPAELRVKTYEMCVPVTDYITYDERDFCTCGGDDHLDQHDSKSESTCVFSYSSGTVSGRRTDFTRRQPGSFYLISPDYLAPEGENAHDHYYFTRKRHKNPRMTPWPGILEATRLIRKEALPVF